MAKIKWVGWIIIGSGLAQRLFAEQDLINTHLSVIGPCVQKSIEFEANAMIFFYENESSIIERWQCLLIALHFRKYRNVNHLTHNENGTKYDIQITLSIHLEFPVISFQTIFRTVETVQFINFVMMTSSNGNIFRVTGPLWGKSPGHR